MRRNNVGQFRVEVTAVGGHGCQRHIKDGGQLQQYCGSPSCPDCAAREFVRTLKRQGHTIEHAHLIHWPGTAGEVRDNLVDGKRGGNF
jgi:hypothetical protein